MEYQTTWNGIAVSIHYIEDYSKAYRQFHGQRLAHLEVRASEPLPVTETGYRSYFLDASIIEDAGGPVHFILRDFDLIAGQNNWKRQGQIPVQLSLF